MVKIHAMVWCDIKNCSLVQASRLVFTDTMVWFDIKNQRPFIEMCISWHPMVPLFVQRLRRLRKYNEHNLSRELFTIYLIYRIIQESFLLWTC